MRAEPSWPKHLSLGPPPNAVALGVKCLTYEFWGMHSDHSNYPDLFRWVQHNHNGPYEREAGESELNRVGRCKAVDS
jgi:hypothetical protein